MLERRRSGATATSHSATTTTPIPSVTNRHHHSKDSASVVVASLPKRTPHPYSSIALSPDRRYAVASVKDTLQILSVGPGGLRLLKTVPIGPHFQATAAAATNTTTTGSNKTSTAGKPISTAGSGGGGVMGRIHEEFTLFGERPTAPPPTPMFDLQVVVTNVAWSNHYPSATASTGSNSNNNKTGKNENQQHQHGPPETANAGTSLIAAAASNGVTVVWNAATFLEACGVKVASTNSAGATGGGSHGANSSKNKSSQPSRFSKGGHHVPPQPATTPSMAPEAVLSEHVRAVNRLAWHPKLPGLLLSASQDSTVLLWERKLTEDASSAKEATATPPAKPTGLQFLFGGTVAPVVPQRTYTWRCRAKFEPKSEAVRDIRWSPFYDEGMW